MAIGKRTGNNDTGTPTKVGGNDWDEMYDYHNGVALAGKSADIATATNYSTGTLSILGYTDITKVSAPGNPASGKIRLYGNSSDDKLYAKKSNGVVVDLEAAGSGGGSAVTNALQYMYWWMYIDTADANKMKATNGITTLENATDAGELLMDIFDSMGATTPFAIIMAPKRFPIRTWDESRTRRGDFAIIGVGKGISVFEVTNDIEDVAGDSRGLSFEAAAGSTTTTLSATCNKGSPSITVTSTTGFAVGNDIILCSDEDWDTAFAGADRTQMNRIVSISGTTIMLEKYADETFNTGAANARIIKQNVLRNIHLKDFSIEAEAGYNNTGTVFLRLDFVSDSLFENIGIKGVLGNFHVALVTNMVTHSRFKHFSMELPASMGHFTTSGPYGISCRAACYDVGYENFTFKGGWRHAFTTTTNTENVKDGVPKKIFVVNPTIETCSEAALDTHGEGEEIYFVNPTISGVRSADSTDTVAGTSDTDAINTRCKNVHIINPMINNCRGKGINFSGGGYGHSVIGGYIRNITNNMEAIRIEAGCSDIQITGTNIDGVGKEGILLMGSNNDVSINNIEIRNVGLQTTSSAIKVINSTDVRISGRIKVGAMKAIEMTGTSDWARIDANCRGSASSTLVGSNNITTGSMGL